MLEHRVPANLAPMPLKRYIRRAWPLLDAREVRQALDGRQVKINGVRCGAQASVRGGDVVTLYVRASFGLEVLFDDGRLMAVCKPQGLPVDVDAQGIGADTLLARLNAAHPGARLLHRLDAPTGGVVLAALCPSVYESGLRAFAERSLQKRYRAVALGAFAREQGEWKDYLVKDAAQARVRVRRQTCAGARPIHTRYRVLEPLGGERYLVELEPVTGRTHQLRAHMAFHGHPLLGDDKYAGREARAPVLCLWCERIEVLPGALGAYAGRVFAAAAPDWRCAFGHSPDRL